MRTFFFVLALLAASVTMAQADFDKRLLVKYNENQIRILQAQNPGVIDYWTYFLDHGYSIVDIPSGKEASIEDELAIPDTNSFNILEVGAGSPGEFPRYFRIKNSNQMLVLPSNDEFVKAFKASKGLQ